MPNTKVLNIPYSILKLRDMIALLSMCDGYADADKQCVTINIPEHLQV